MGAAELGRYRLKRVLGRGAMGEVWEAHDTELGRRVAVKIMHTTDDELALARTRFGREARIAAVLRHPNIVVVHDAGEVAGTCFMVMELVEGRPLRSLIAMPNVSLEDKLRWIREIGDALAAMHENGIVHRDVKPDNIIIRADNSACLVDFGIAKWSRAEQAPTVEPGAPETAEGIIVGTPDYLPPETRYAGVFDERSDQYAWAVTAYELLAGVHPADVNGRSLKERADIPEPVISVIEKARSKLPQNRFLSIEEAVAALSLPQETADESKVVTRERGRARAPVESASRAPFFAIGVLAALAIGTAAIVLWLLMHDKKPKKPDDVPAPSASTTANAPPSVPEIPSAPDPSSTAAPSAHGRAHATSTVANVSMPAWVPHASVEEFARTHEAVWAGCFASTPAPCRGKTLRLSCDMGRGGTLMHCSPAWTPPIEDAQCSAVKACVKAKLRPALRHLSSADPPFPKIDIQVVVPQANDTKTLHAALVVRSDAFTDAEKAAFIRANRATYDACIAKLPICSAHTWIVRCAIQPDGSPRDCRANPRAIQELRATVDYDCHAKVGACMQNGTKGFDSTSDAGTREVAVDVEFSAVKLRKPD